MLARRDAELAGLTSLGLGGPARELVTAYDEAELVAAVRAADARADPVLVLGGGTNLVLPDAGFPGTVVRVSSHGRVARRDGEEVLLEVAAGENWDDLVALCVAEGWAGVECLSGIPGSTGATPVQNVGAYGQEVAGVLAEVRVHDRRTGRTGTRSAAACGLTYRSSAFKADPERWVVLAVVLRLREDRCGAPLRYAELARTLDLPLGARAPQADVRAAVLALRRAKGMVLDPTDPDSRSAGSFFTNPVLDPRDGAALRTRVQERFGLDLPSYVESDGRIKVSAAWLIERAGFGPGFGVGPVGVSSKHSLALVHRGGGSTAALLDLARQVRAGVQATFGVTLTAEPMIVGDVL